MPKETTYVLTDRAAEAIHITFNPAAYRDFDDMADHLIEALIHQAINRRNAECAPGR